VQINRFGSAGYNRLGNTHPLRARITEGAIADLDENKVKNIQTRQFCFLRKPETIQSLSKRQLVHLKKEHLVHRKDSFAAYVIGVFTLGVVACLVSLSPQHAPWP
jgi:hypothetical protein